MVPKDFKDRILLNMETEVKLNYLKWLTQGLEIDMFEIMSMLIIYSQCDLTRRLELIFQLFCYNEDLRMDRFEFKFMMNKLCCSIGATLQIKKSFLHDLITGIDQKFLNGNAFDQMNKISMEEFVA